MTRFGRCPSCHSYYELEESDVGHLMECECGVPVFACNASAMPSIPVRCDVCAEEYEADSVDAGQQVECECGQSLTVPTVVFRLPIGTAETAAAAMAEALVDQAKDVDLEEGRHEIGMPGANVDSVGSLKGEPSVTGQRAGNGLGNIDNKDSNSHTLAMAPEAGVAAATRDSTGGQAIRPRAKSSLGTWLSMGGVGVLLLFAIGMFVLREPPSVRSATRKPSGQAATDQRQNEEMGAGGELSSANASHGDTSVDPSLITEVASLGMALTSPSVTNHVGEAVAAVADAADGGNFNSFTLPPAPLYALPKPTNRRPRVALSEERIPRMTLGRGVARAFESFEESQELRSASEQSKSDADLKAYHLSLGKTIPLVEHVHRLATAEADQEQINRMRYLLAYLYYAAGHLPEACILGEAAARWGDKSDPATKESAMIALAATQELSETQWADPEQVGELSQMEAIVALLAKRWPQDEQLDLIWMNLAYLYEAFNSPRRAIGIYKRLDSNSSQYADAQIALALAQWMILRRDAISNQAEPDREKLREARASLQKGLRSKEGTGKSLTPVTVQARLTLAQIDVFLGDLEKAEAWLVESPPSVIDSIRVFESEGSESAVQVEESVARQVFDVVFFVRQRAGDGVGATNVLGKMSEVVQASEAQVEARRLSLVKGLVDQLKASESVAVSEVEHLRELTLGLLADESSFPTSNLLWLGESWGEIGLRVDDPGVASECFDRAASLYETAMLRTDFPASSLQAARLRRIEWLRRSGKVLESLKVIEEILAKNPNVFSLQMEAAESLQQLAFDSGRASDLSAAIEGPSGFSPVWGWGKLVNALHATRWSGNGTDRHAEQLYRSQYSFARCRYLLAMQSTEPANQRSQLSDLERSLTTSLATMDKANIWYVKFEELLGVIRKRR